MKGECDSKSVKLVFTGLIPPNRILIYAILMKGECDSKSVKLVFTGLDTAEPHLNICNINER